MLRWAVLCCAVLCCAVLCCAVLGAGGGRGARGLWGGTESDAVREEKDLDLSFQAGAPGAKQGPGGPALRLPQG